MDDRPESATTEDADEGTEVEVADPLGGIAVVAAPADVDPQAGRPQGRCHCDGTPGATGDGSTRSGTITGIIPAAAAALMPASESSRTTQPAGRRHAGTRRREGTGREPACPARPRLRPPRRRTAQAGRRLTDDARPRPGRSNIGMSGPRASTKNWHAASTVRPTTSTLHPRPFATVQRAYAERGAHNPRAERFQHNRALRRVRSMRLSGER